MHLQLPGYQEGGPTLEIFQYQPERPSKEEAAINRQGLGHLAFHVDEVETVLAEVIAHGEKQLGKVRSPLSIRVHIGANRLKTASHRQVAK